jgi:V8-like Glu-specific endopeptidase
MTTFSGQSGSPVIYDEKIIAVHIKSGKSDGKGRFLYNVGRLLTLDVIANLQKWAK